MSNTDNNTKLLRLFTAGSVDDGKSTLIGRLLYDTKSVFDDQHEEIKKYSKRRGELDINLALLTDGLRAEREQGITIDVAYRFFSTKKRKFMIADTPGHLQYTRNMFTGASTANLSIILIDARKGILEQTRRHTYIASLLKVSHIAICINKMDLVNYDVSVFERIKKEFLNFSTNLDFLNIEFIPISALKGDNVVSPSKQMEWYKGNTLIYYLENIKIDSEQNLVEARFPVQYVIKPLINDHSKYRIYTGRISSGTYKKGDKVHVLPSGTSTTIAKIDTFDSELSEAFSQMSVSFQLKDDLDISRGDMIVHEGALPVITQNFDALICWFNLIPLRIGGKYILLHTTRELLCVVNQVYYLLDINSLNKKEDFENVAMNDIAKIHIKTTKPIFIDPYNINKETGSFILVDESTNDTVAAGIII